MDDQMKHKADETNTQQEAETSEEKSHSQVPTGSDDITPAEEKAPKTETAEKETPPEVSGEEPQDPNIVGALSQEEMAKLQMLRQRGSQLTMEIGTLELRKTRILGSVAEVEGQGQELLNAVAKRLGIPDGQQWQVMPDGRARILQNVTPMQGGQQMPPQGNTPQG